MNTPLPAESISIKNQLNRYAFEARRDMLYAVSLGGPDPARQQHFTMFRIRNFHRQCNNVIGLLQSIIAP